MKILRLLFVSAVLLVLAGACDIIEAPYLDNPSQASIDEQCLLDAQQIEPFGPSNPITKRVLLEEMTGHKCGNCPDASKVAHKLIDEKFAGQLILVTIHSGPLAKAFPNADKYFTDFTTDEGDELYSELNSSSAVPFGMIDRINMNNNENSWESFVSAELDKAPEAGIRIYSCYDPDSMKATSVIDIKYLVNATADEYLSVYLVEDNIVDWQTDYTPPGNSPDLPDYVHRDVFRGTFNGTWGQPLTDGNIAANDQFTVSYSLNLKESFKPENCKIVAFVHNISTREIRQVESVPLVQ